MKVNTLSASTLSGNDVKNPKGEKLGTIKDIMFNLNDGFIAYAVLESGGFLGFGDKLFAIPWQQIKVDQENKCCVIDMPKERLENSPGFDRNHWPKTGDTEYLAKVYDYHKTTPFWSES